MRLKALLNLFVLLFISTFFLPFLTSVNATAGINRTINFQGKIVNKVAGTNISNGSYSFTFKFYNASSGGTQLPSGTPWSETQSLTVTDGIFRATLGASTPIPTGLDFNDDSIYLDITFNGETFGSRVRMTSVPYALNAEKVGGLTVTNTTGTLTIPNGKTITFNDAFSTAGAGTLTLTTSGTSTNATFPTGSITVVDTAATQTLTGKTLTSPRIGTSILDTNGANLFTLAAAASANNYLAYTNAANGANPTFTSTAGSDANLGITFVMKAAGNFVVGSTTTNSDTLKLAPNASGSSTFAGIITTADITTSDKTYTFPDQSGTVTVLGNTTTGSGSTLVLDTAPAFTTSISTPSILTASGNLTLTPNGSDVTLSANKNFTFTAGTGTLTLNSTVTTTDDALLITPSFTSTTTAQTYNLINLAGFTGSNTTGTDIINGIFIGNLTESGAGAITSSALNIGNGYDNAILFEKGTNDLQLRVTAPSGASRVATIPALTADDNFVFEAFAQTLTNKTIAAGSNTISGITNSHLSGSAGITSANLGTDISATNLAATLTFASTDYIDLSAVTHGTTPVMGLRLPNAASATPSSPTGGLKGFLAYDTAGNQLIAYNGSAWTTVGGGSQTPWAQDISAAGFDLTSLSNLLFQDTTGAPTATDVSLYRDNTGDLTANVLSGKTFNIAVAGTQGGADEYNFSSTALAFNSNDITGLGSITSAAGLILNTTSSGHIALMPNGTGNVGIGISTPTGAKLEIVSTQTSGILQKIGASGTPTLASLLTGLSLDLGTGYISTGIDQTGLSITIDDDSNMAAAIKRGINISSGNITQNTAGNGKYVGVDITLPNTQTFTTGTTLQSYGLRITSPATMSGGAANTNITQSIYIVPPSSGAAAGAFYGINMGQFNNGAGTDVAINLGFGWDTAIKYAAANPGTFTSGGFGIDIDLNTNVTSTGGTMTGMRLATAADSNIANAAKKGIVISSGNITENTAANNGLYVGADITMPATFSLTSGTSLIGHGVRVTTPTTVSGAGTTVNGLTITATGVGASTVLNAVQIDNLASAGSGTETALNIGTGWDTGISIASGGLTISAGALAINNSTGLTSNQATLIINASGAINIQDNLDIDGTLTVGSGNTVLTDATGFILHDGLVDCADTQILKWATGGGRWGCAADATSAGGTGTLQQSYDAGGAGDQVIALDATQDSLIFRNPASAGTDSGYVLKIDQLKTDGTVDGLVIANAGTSYHLHFLDSSGNNIGGFKQYFATSGYGAFEANGFINIDGGFRADQFLTTQVAATADVTNFTSKFGDYRDWGMDEAGTGAGGTNTQQAGCKVYANADTNFQAPINGAVRILLDTTTVAAAGNNWCMFNQGGAASSTGTNATFNNFLQVANKFVAYYKIRLGSNVTNNASNRYIYLGVNNMTGGTTGRPANNSGIWFSNVVGNQTQTGTNYTAGTSWVGNVNNGTNATNYSTVACSGMNLSASTATNAWALMRIEARATNDVRFFMDADVSNGISLTECGSGVTNNIPTNRMKPSLMIANSGTNSATWELDMDLFAFVQDDPRDGVGATQAESSGLDNPIDGVPPPPDPITGADVAENYYIEGDYEPGDIMVMNGSAGGAMRASINYDRKLIGVVSESPGLVLGATASNSSPIALNGRVPVKVSTKAGPIKMGDPITSSDIPGVGIKATKPGKIIGTAMENFIPEEGQTQGKVMVFVNIGYYLGDESDTALLEQPDEMVLGASDSAKLNISGLTSVASQSAVIEEGLTHESTGSARIQSEETIFEKAVHFKNNISINGMFESFGEAIFSGPTKFLANVRFEKLAEFIDEAVFNKKVTFKEQVEFNKDTAGYARIKAGDRFVDVVFDKEYGFEPVVNVNPTIPKLTESDLTEKIVQGICIAGDSITICQEKVIGDIFNQDLKFTITGKTKQGFMIMLNHPILSDITFSWTAIAVKDAQVSESKSGQQSNVPEISITPILNPSPSPEVFISPTPQPTGNSEPTVTITDTPSPIPTEKPISLPSQ